MNTITAISKPHADWTLHLPMPAAWGKQAIRVTAELELVGGNAQPQASLIGFGCLQGKISMSPDFDEPLEDFKDYTS